MINNEVVTAAKQLAFEETEAFGLPTRLHLDLSLAKAEEIAKALHADVAICVIGACMMDVKLGEAFKAGKLGEHVAMSAARARDFLASQKVTGEEVAKILNCVEAHHLAVPFSCIEAEVVANADCYRFMHPTGVYHYIGTLTKRNLAFREIIDGAEAKLEEKMGILSLPHCKAELGPYYTMFKESFAAARELRP